MKNKKKISLRTKAEVILIVLLFVGIAVSSVFGTVTITDTSMSTDDSGLVINFEEGWVNVWNATVDNESVDATVINQWNLAYTYIGDQWFNASKAATITDAMMVNWNTSSTITSDMMLGWNASNVTLIRNSNGNSYAVTGAGLQAAIWDLNSTNGGKVNVPQCNLTFTETLYIPDNVWIQGTGNRTIFYLDDNANVTMIENQNAGVVSLGVFLDNGQNYNIRLSDFTMYGNQYNQPKWDTGANYFREKEIIRLTNVNDGFIENVDIYDGLNVGVHLVDCEDIFIDNIYVYGNGLYWSEGLAGQLEHITPGGVFVGSSINTTIINSKFENCWNYGIVSEKTSLTNSPNFEMWSRHLTVSDCFFSDLFCGIWVERGGDVLVTNCVFNNINRVETVYTETDIEPTGILLSTLSGNNTVSNCLFQHIGNSSTNEGQAMIVNSWNTTVSNCVIKDVFGNGTVLGSSHVIFNGNRIYDTTYYGIYASVSSTIKHQGEVIVTNNHVSRVGKAGINIANRGSGYGGLTVATIISGNIVLYSLNPTDGTSWSGIWANAVDSLTITDNGIAGFNNGIYVVGDNCIINDNKVTDSLGTGSYNDAGIFTNGHNNTINGNNLRGCAYKGIASIGDRCSISNNVVCGSAGAGEGIRLGTTGTFSGNNTLMGNIVSGFTTGIIEYTGWADWNIFIGNNVRGNTNGITNSGANDVKEHNLEP